MTSRSGSAAETGLQVVNSESSTPPRHQLIRALIFNDHPVFRSALSWKIGNDTGVEVVADSPSLYETLALVNAAPGAPNIDIVVADLRIGDGNSEGIESIKTLAARLRQVPVIACSDLFSRSYIGRLQEAGAAAVLQKSGSIERLVEAIHAAMDDSTPIRGTAAPTTATRAA